MKRMMKSDTFSTGKLAELCHVTKHTIISAIERGELRASKTPGGHNRVRKEDAILFMRKYNVFPEEGGVKILVMDPEEVVGDLVKELMDGKGYQVFHAKTAFEAGVIFERELPRLILLDASAPALDRHDICEYAHGKGTGEVRAKVLALAPRKQDLDPFFLKAVDDYLVKPFSIEVLQQKIKALLTVPEPI